MYKEQNNRLKGLGVLILCHWQHNELAQTSSGSEILVRKDTLMVAAVCPSSSSRPMIEGAVPNWQALFSWGCLKPKLTAAREKISQTENTRTHGRVLKNIFICSAFQHWQIQIGSHTYSSSSVDSNSSAFCWVQSVLSLKFVLLCSNSMCKTCSDKWEDAVFVM